MKNKIRVISNDLHVILCGHVINVHDAKKMVQFQNITFIKYYISSSIFGL